MKQNIERLICEASGLSTTLDATLLALASNVNESKLNEQRKVIKSMRKQIKELNKTIDSIKIEYSNQGVTDERINSAREAIVKEFNDSPKVIFWYIQMYNERFFELIPQPAIRLTICKELVKQAAKYYPEMTSGIAISSGGGRNTNLEIVRG
jgi:nitric oxide reductase activation protein